MAAILVATPVIAFDGDEVFRKGTRVLTVEGGGGWQDNLDGPTLSDLEVTNVGLRLSLIPFDPWLSGPARGALEVGLEPFFQTYRHPDATFGGLGLSLRYHFLVLGRVVPYVELFGAAGGSDLRIPEIDSTFTLMAQGGAGVALFLTDRIALYAGYRLQHVSNAHVSTPNRGFEAHLGVAGVSIFFP
jgi:Lipid A 3-O-deacylase (PagL)